MKLNKKLRAIEIKKGIAVPNAGSNGYFHGWCDKPCLSESGFDYIGKYALIEFLDGSVKFIDPDAIKFTQPYSPKKL